MRTSLALLVAAAIANAASPTTSAGPAQSSPAGTPKKTVGKFSNYKNSDSYCLTAESDTDGAPLGISVCHKVTDVYPNGNQTFTIPLIPPFLSAATPGPVSTFNDKKCVDVPNGNTANGQLLQVWSCVEGNTNQQWEFNAEWGWFRLVGTDKCIDLPDGNAYPGARVQLWDCDTYNENQHFRYSS